MKVEVWMGKGDGGYGEGGGGQRVKCEVVCQYLLFFGQRVCDCI